jgi:hypothetical protein
MLASPDGPKLHRLHMFGSGLGGAGGGHAQTDRGEDGGEGVREPGGVTGHRRTPVGDVRPATCGDPARPGTRVYYPSERMSTKW